MYYPTSMVVKIGISFWLFSTITAQIRTLLLGSIRALRWNAFKIRATQRSKNKLLCVCRPLGSENLLLRGATLKNTEYIYGNIHLENILRGFTYLHDNCWSKIELFLQRLPSTPAWKPRWRSTTSPRLRSGPQWKSKLSVSRFQIMNWFWMTIYFSRVPFF